MSQPGPDEWSACPPGELQRLAGRLRGRKHRRVLLRAGTVTSAVVLVAAMAFYVGRGGERFDGGISCSKVIQAAEAFRDDRLDAGIRAQVLTHLDGCSDCRQHYKDMGLIIEVPDSAVPHGALAMLLGHLRTTQSAASPIPTSQL